MKILGNNSAVWCVKWLKKVYKSLIFTAYLFLFFIFFVFFFFLVFFFIFFFWLFTVETLYAVFIFLFFSRKVNNKSPEMYSKTKKTQDDEKTIIELTKVNVILISTEIFFVQSLIWIYNIFQFHFLWKSKLYLLQIKRYVCTTYSNPSKTNTSCRVSVWMKFEQCITCLIQTSLLAKINNWIIRVLTRISSV